MIIVGIDPSLGGTGLVSIDEKGKVLDTQVLKVKSMGVARLIELKGLLASFLKRQSEPPSLIIVEGYSFGSRLGQAFSLGEWGGVLRVSLVEGSFAPWMDVPPTRARKLMCGKGNLPKIMVPKEAYKKWGVDFSSDDLYDAYVLARVGLSYTIFSVDPSKVTKAEAEILKDLVKIDGKPK